MIRLAAILYWQAVLLAGLPQQSAKIIFSTDHVHPLVHRDCDHDQSQLFWLEDGHCYQAGERGPCNFGEVLWFGKKPVCIPLTEVPSALTRHKLCNDEGMIMWPATGLCYFLLTQGPCPGGQWLQLSSSSTVTCAPQPCEQAGLEVFWPEVCGCIPAGSPGGGGWYGEEDVCGRGGELVWTPYGEGICTCSDNYYADQAGRCFEIGSAGPCLQGDIWGVVNGSTSCIKNYNKIRVFDLIPPNNPTPRTSQAYRCHVDELGNCRKTLNLINKFGNSENFTSWLAGFKKRSPEQCHVVTCDGDMLPWLDGKCYHLPSTGPCQEGSWLVLDSMVDGEPVIKCKTKKCNYGVWWPANCSCMKKANLPKLPVIDSANKTNSVSLCEENEQVLLNPFGEGMCACKDGHVRNMDGNCYQLGQQGPCQFTEVFSVEDGIPVCVTPANVTYRIFDLIPVNKDPFSRAVLGLARATRHNCHVDEIGKCRKVLNLRGRNDFENSDKEDKENNDLKTWLGTFAKQPDNCQVNSKCKEDMFLCMLMLLMV